MNPQDEVDQCIHCGRPDQLGMDGLCGDCRDEIEAEDLAERRANRDHASREGRSYYG